jgi:hypothetical protein
VSHPITLACGSGFLAEPHFVTLACHCLEQVNFRSRRISPLREQFLASFKSSRIPKDAKSLTTQSRAAPVKPSRASPPQPPSTMPSSASSLASQGNAISLDDMNSMAASHPWTVEYEGCRHQRDTPLIHVHSHMDWHVLLHKEAGNFTTLSKSTHFHLHDVNLDVTNLARPHYWVFSDDNTCRGYLYGKRDSYEDQGGRSRRLDSDCIAETYDAKFQCRTFVPPTDLVATVDFTVARSWYPDMISDTDFTMQVHLLFDSSTRQVLVCVLPACFCRQLCPPFTCFRHSMNDPCRAAGSDRPRHHSL